jgi:hypothetical protein
MSFLNKKKLIICGLVVLLITCYAVFAAVPGSEDDPLVSKSYIEETIIPQIKEYIDDKISRLNGNNGENISSIEFAVVSVTNGQSLIGQGGTELILRMGTANIIATEKGGIADVTAGTDLSNGVKMPSNHLLIIPLSDGRGLKATSDILVMVKGSYVLE